MFNLTPFKNQTNQVSSGNGFFDLFNQMENMMFNSFQSSFNTMNNTSFIDQGSEYIFTLTLPNLKRENIQLVVEDQLLILTVKQEYQATQDGAQSYQSSSFSQTFNLGDVESNNITARLNQDTLTIIFPKKATTVINRRVINVL
ncbi:Hsp20/alpha crystallin family protein [Turicibacter sanguinis]|uniref:Hsp20/alpha crystallin family protein n=1 Tax=Turicibacter sanguinis TaxID=154288 RepID=UPI0021D50EC2|nr:Hsp20 family protein [Turicibacter sanguinis]MCU7202698.1 Hsp20 family protein [Turicibacter sanguinis]